MRSVLVEHERGFGELFDLGGGLRVLAEGLTWAEGPTFDARSGSLYFSDVPGNVLYRRVGGAVEVFRAPSGYANGNTIDESGALLTCEQLHRRITRTTQDGSCSTVVDSYEGRPLNSPNDVVVHSDGSIWFTDPDYGIRSDDQGVKAPREQPGCFVYRFDPASGELRVAADDLVMPNGLAFTPDERTLYVADSAYTHDPNGPRHIRAYDVDDNGVLRGSRIHVQIDVGWPDGLRVDTAGRLWCAAGDGVRCYAPNGTWLGLVRTPEIAANVCFADIDGRSSLVITATSRVYAAPFST